MERTNGRWSSDQVRSMQEALKQAGQDPGEIDGRMGPRTRKALMAYQREQNLKSEREALDKLGVDVSTGRPRK
jgi:peptidoglycan hydrolase-like protein with peptidoglycan-binding domain